MNKYALDYTQLNEQLTPKKWHKLSDVQDRIEKVAWDVVRFTDSDNIDNLWKIERRGDDEVIVSMYDNDDAIEATASVKVQNPWASALDKSGSNVNVFYKGEAVKKISLASVGVSVEDGKSLTRNLPKMLSTNSSLVKKMFKDASEDEKALLFSKYPELNQQ